MTTLDIRQLAEHGGVNPIAPVTVPEAVKFEDGADLNTAIGSVATIETSPATATHAIGDYIVWNGQLYKVTAAIAVGETLSTSTNVSATNLGSELNAGLMHRIFGSWSITTINAYQTLERTVTFDSVMPDTNYSVILVVSVGGAGWASIAYRIADKNTSGFKITVFNDSNSTVSNFTIEYAVLY